MPELDFNSWLEAELQAVADRLGKPVEIMTADWVIERLLAERAAGGGTAPAPAAPTAPAGKGNRRQPTAAMKAYYQRNRTNGKKSLTPAQEAHYQRMRDRAAAKRAKTGKKPRNRRKPDPVLTES